MQYYNPDPTYSPPTQLMRNYQEQGQLLHQLQAAGRPIYFKQQENWIKPINTDRHENYIQNGGKKRYLMPDNEISRKNIFLMPKGPLDTDDNRSYAQLDYDRNLITDDIEGTKPGTKLNPSLKNLLKAQLYNLKQYNQSNHNNNNNNNNNNFIANTPQQEKLQPQQMYNQYRQPQLQQIPQIQQMQQISPYQQQQQYTPYENQRYNNHHPRALSNNSFQETGKNILYNNSSSLSRPIPNKSSGIWGFSKLGIRKSYPAQKFGKGLKDMDLL